VAAMAGQADARLDAFGLSFARDETRIFVMGPVFTREHEDESITAVIKERTRAGGQHQLTIPGGDAPRDKQDARVVRNLPSLAQCVDPLLINGRGVERGRVDLAWNHGE